MALSLRPGDRVRLATEPTYQGEWDSDFVGPAEGVGGWGTVVFSGGDAVDVRWDNPQKAVLGQDVYGIDVACLALDLPPSLSSEEVEAWLTS